MPCLQPLPCCNGMQTAAEPWRCTYRPLWSCQRGGHLNFKGSNWTAGCVHAVWDCMCCICILELIHSLIGDLRTTNFLSVSYTTYNSFTIFRLGNIWRIFVHIFLFELCCYRFTMGAFIAKMLLPTVSSLVFLPTASVAAKRGFHMEAMVYFFTMFFTAVRIHLWFCFHVRDWDSIGWL